MCSDTISTFIHYSSHHTALILFSQQQPTVSFIIDVLADFVDFHAGRLFGSFARHRIAESVHAVTLQQSVALLRRVKPVGAAEGVFKVGDRAALQQIPLLTDVVAAGTGSRRASVITANAGRQQSGLQRIPSRNCSRRSKSVKGDCMGFYDDIRVLEAGRKRFTVGAASKKVGGTVTSRITTF